MISKIKKLLNHRNQDYIRDFCEYLNIFHTKKLVYFNIFIVSYLRETV